jgi:hypothetical protein
MGALWPRSMRTLSMDNVHSWRRAGFPRSTAKASTISSERWRPRCRRAAPSSPMSSGGPPPASQRRRQPLAFVVTMCSSRSSPRSSIEPTNSRHNDIIGGLKPLFKPLTRWLFQGGIRTCSLAMIRFAQRRALVAALNGSSKPSGNMIPTTFFVLPFRCQSVRRCTNGVRRGWLQEALRHRLHRRLVRCAAPRSLSRKALWSSAPQTMGLAARHSFLPRNPRAVSTIPIALGVGGGLSGPQRSPPCVNMAAFILERPN